MSCLEEQEKGIISTGGNIREKVEEELEPTKIRII